MVYLPPTPPPPFNPITHFIFWVCNERKERLRPHPPPQNITGGGGRLWGGMTPETVDVPCIELCVCVCVC